MLKVLKKAALIGLLLLSLSLNGLLLSHPLIRVILVPIPTPAPCVKFDPLNPQSQSQEISWAF